MPGSVDVFLEEVDVSELVQRSVEIGFGHMEGPRPAPATPAGMVRPPDRRGCMSIPPCAAGGWASTNAASSVSW